MKGGRQLNDAALLVRKLEGGRRERERASPLERETTSRSLSLNNQNQVIMIQCKDMHVQNGSRRK
jgi:hypothetical protein